MCPRRRGSAEGTGSEAETAVPGASGSWARRRARPTRADAVDWGVRGDPVEGWGVGPGC